MKAHKTTKNYYSTTRIKVCTESKSADRTLQLDLIKRRIVPKKYSQHYDIKIVNSKKFVE